MQTIYCNWWDAEEPRKWTRDIDDQKSNQEKIEIRATRSAACGIRGERKEFSGPPATLKNAQRPARRRRYQMQRNGGTKSSRPKANATKCARKELRHSPR